MRTIVLVLFMSIIMFAPGSSWSQVEGSAGGSALQASNLLNPNISVVGWFQAEAGHRSDPEESDDIAPFEFKEAEIAIQSVIDPYARADFFIAIEGESIDLEEGTITWFSLPYSLSLKLGKAKADFGRFNRTHAAETAFADRPLVHEAYFGEEGLSGAGAFLSWQIPNPWLFLNLDLEAMTMPEGEETPAFEVAKRNDLLYVGRLGGYADLTEETNVSAGASYAHGTAGQDFDPINNSSTTLKSQLFGLDLTLRWKNPRRALYRSLLWQTEILWNKRDRSPMNSVSTLGLFSHIEYQFVRRWRAGIRYDWSESPQTNNDHDQGALGYLTFMPSEFSLLSLQGRQVKKADGTMETLGWFKVTFNIGPHGSHPF